LRRVTWPTNNQFFVCLFWFYFCRSPSSSREARIVHRNEPTRRQSTQFRPRLLTAASGAVLCRPAAADCRPRLLSIWFQSGSPRKSPADTLKFTPDI
jgi:hypothetical protein